MNGQVKRLSTNRTAAIVETFTRIDDGLRRVDVRHGAHDAVDHDGCRHA
jgi:hypothetical protein